MPNEDANEARMRAMEERARRREEEAQRKAEEEARRRAANPPPRPPPVAEAAVYRWDPRGDDPRTQHKDGKTYSDEAAIADREALHAAKAEAWALRAERLRDSGRVQSAIIAEGHAVHHVGRIGLDD